MKIQKNEYGTKLRLSAQNTFDWAHRVGSSSAMFQAEWKAGVCGIPPRMGILWICRSMGARGSGVQRERTGRDCGRLPWIFASSSKRAGARGRGAMKHVHRAGVGARPLCGAPDGFLSFSGNAHFITCPKCKRGVVAGSCGTTLLAPRGCREVQNKPSETGGARLAHSSITRLRRVLAPSGIRAEAGPGCCQSRSGDGRS